MSNQLPYNREHKDFLGRPFVNQKCPRCKKVYQRMELDNKGKVCPPCDNAWFDSENENDD